MLSTRFAVFLLVGAVAAACQSGPKVTADPPQGEHDLVLRMVELPGMLPPGGALTMPEISVYGGGLAIVTTGSGLVQRKLTAAGVNRVAQAAADAGLAGKVPPGDPPGPDAGSVTFVVVSGGQRHVNSVVAPGDEIRELIKRLRDLDSFLGGDIAPEATPYRHSKLAVYAQPEQTSAQTRAWEFDDLATAGEPYDVGRCQVVTGAELEKLRGAKSGEHWRSGGATFYVIFRPLLPEEKACPRVESLTVS